MVRVQFFGATGANLCLIGTRQRQASGLPSFFFCSSGYPLGLVASRLAIFCTNSYLTFYGASHRLVTVLKNQFSCRSVVSTKELRSK